MATENIQNYIQVRYIEMVKEKPVHIVFVDGTETNAVIAGSDTYCLLIYEIKEVEKEGEKKTVITHSSLIFKSAVSKIICKGGLQMNLAEPVSESQSSKGNKPQNSQQKKGNTSQNNQGQNKKKQNGETTLPDNRKQMPPSISNVSSLREQPKKNPSRVPKMLGAKVDFEGLGKKEDEQGMGMDLPDISIESRPDTDTGANTEAQTDKEQNMQNMQESNEANASVDTGAGVGAGAGMQGVKEEAKDERKDESSSGSAGTLDALADVPEFDFAPANDTGSESDSMEISRNDDAWNQISDEKKEKKEDNSTFTSQDVVSNQNAEQEDKKEALNSASNSDSSSNEKKENDDDDEYDGNPSLDEFLKILQ